MLPQSPLRAQGGIGEIPYHETRLSACPPDSRFLAHLPVSLDLAAATRREWVAYAAWVVSAVVFRRFVEKVDEADYVPLATEFIEKNIPGKVRRDLLDDLLRHGVLECDNVY